MSIEKAITICKQFEVSKQFWPYLVKEDLIENFEDFIKLLPHHSWVIGKVNVDYLEKRFNALKSTMRLIILTLQGIRVQCTVVIKNLKTNKKQYLESEHVFIEAGGFGLLLLQKVGINEKGGSITCLLGAL